MPEDRREEFNAALALARSELEASFPEDINLYRHGNGDVLVADYFNFYQIIYNNINPLQGYRYLAYANYFKTRYEDMMTRSLQSLITTNSLDLSVSELLDLMNGEQSAGGEDEIFFFHNDHLGTPQILTNSEQQKVWEAHYKAYGEAVIVSEAIKNNIRFAGQYYDGGNRSSLQLF